MGSSLFDDRKQTVELNVVHQVKGLEYDVVSIDQGLWTCSTRPQHLKVLYVALTRARFRLEIRADIFPGCWKRSVDLDSASVSPKSAQLSKPCILGESRAQHYHRNSDGPNVRYGRGPLCDFFFNIQACSGD